ncbi:MAG: hypothetical protein AAF357_10250, partial [Verrucomicrobiota bacterium]
MPGRRLIHTFFRLAGGKIVLSILLLLGVGLIQGAGLLLLLPFLHLVGIGDSETEESMPSAVAWIVDLVGEFGIPWTLPAVLLGFVLAISLVSILNFWQAVHQSRLVREVTQAFQIRFYRKWMFQPWIESNQYSGGEILNFVQRDIGQLSLFLTQGLRLGTTVVLALAYSFVAFQISFQLTLLALMAGGVLFLVL